MSRHKTKYRCAQCKQFEPFDTWRSTFFGIYAEGICKGTGNVIHNHHYACKHFIQDFVAIKGKTF